MSKICVWDYIIFLGIYAATLSSAIASVVGAPRYGSIFCISCFLHSFCACSILMAIASDDIIAVPGISYFAKTNKNGEPVRGYFLSFALAFGVNW